MQNWGCDIISFDEMFKIIAFEKDNSNDSEYISQMTLFEEVIDEMIKQDIPCINAQSIFMGF